MRWLVVLAGCTTRATPPDALDDRPLLLTINVSSIEPIDRPPHDPAPKVYIDNIATNTFERRYGSNLEARSQTHLIELRHGSTTLRAKVVDLELVNSCADRARPADSVAFDYCLLESGDLRFGSDLVMGPRGICVGDGFCAYQCQCTAQERCTSRVTSIDPPASHLACAPIGPKQLGEACSLVDSPNGAYDDCGAQLLCVGGVCRATCVGSCAGCTYVPGHAPELLVCP